MNIYAATANIHKLKEINSILAPEGINALPHPLYCSVEVAETGATFEENAIIKAIALGRQSDGWVLADDSGISVKALDGAPGIYSARFAGEGATDLDNNMLLLERMKGVTARDASFICVVALVKNGKHMTSFRGELKGVVATEPCGEGGFGYDPVFLLPDGRSVACLAEDEKNRISHRRMALKQVADYLRTLQKR